MSSKKFETIDGENPVNTGRRQIIKAAAGASLMSLIDPSIRAGAWAAGSDSPEKTEVSIGFLPLTDCAPIVMASVMGFDKKHGIKIIPSKEVSFANVRDKLANGNLDASQMLYSMIYGIQLGIGGLKRDMANLLTLNQNGQAITLSSGLAEKGVKDGDTFAKQIRKEKREYTIAQTFPTGTHAMWIYYWLATYGINPLTETRSVTVPGPQMVANMRVGNMDAFCAGEPWNARAVVDKIGFTAATTQDIWKNHPEKILATTADYVEKYPNTTRAMMAAILEAARFIDASISNRQKTASTIAAKSYVNVDEELILDRMLGRYTNGLGKTWDDPNPMRFFDEGQVNFPYLSDGMWFMTQQKRWGIIKEHPDYLAITKKVNRIDLYKQAAMAAGVPTPKSDMRAATKLIDGVTWDPSKPQAYADSFKIRA